MAKSSAKQSAVRDKDANVIAAGAYFLLIIPVIGVLIDAAIHLTQKGAFVKFHSLQAALLGVVGFVVFIIVGALPLLNLVLVPVLSLIGLLLWLYLMYEAYSGRRVELPVIGKLAADNC